MVFHAVAVVERSSNFGAGCSCFFGRFAKQFKQFNRYLVILCRSDWFDDRHSSLQEVENEKK